MKTNHSITFMPNRQSLKAGYKFRGSILRSFAICTLVLAMLFGGELNSTANFNSRATTPYKIVNNLSCDIWVAYDILPTPSGPACCAGGILVPAGSFVWAGGAPCICPNNVSEVWITVEQVDGVAVTKVGLNSGNQSHSDNKPTSCGGGTWTANWSTIQTIVN